MPGLSKLQKGKIADSLKFYSKQFGLNDEAVHAHIKSLIADPAISSKSEDAFLPLSQYILYLRAIYFNKEAQRSKDPTVAKTKLKKFDNFLLNIDLAEKSQHFEEPAVTTHKVPLQLALIDLIAGNSIEDKKRNDISSYLLLHFEKTLCLEDLVQLFYRIMSDVVTLGNSSAGDIESILPVLLRPEVIIYAKNGIISFKHAKSWGYQATINVAKFLTKEPYKKLIEKGYIENLGVIDKPIDLLSCLKKIDLFIIKNKKTRLISKALLTDVTRYDLSKAIAILTALETIPQSVLDFIATSSSWLLPKIANCDITQRKFLLDALYFSEVKDHLIKKSTSLELQQAVDEIIKVWSIESAPNLSDLNKPSFFAKLAYLNNPSLFSKLASLEEPSAALPQITEESTKAPISSKTKIEMFVKLPIVKYNALWNLIAELNKKKLRGLLWFPEPSGIRKIRQLLQQLPQNSLGNKSTDTVAIIKQTPQVAAIYAEVMQILKRESESTFKIFKRRAVNEFYQNTYHSLLNQFSGINDIKSAYALGMLFKTHSIKRAANICFAVTSTNEPDYLLAVYEKMQSTKDSLDITPLNIEFEKAIKILQDKKEYLHAAEIFYAFGMKLYQQGLYPTAWQYFTRGEIEADAASCEATKMKFSNAKSKFPKGPIILEKNEDNSASNSSETSPLVAHLLRSFFIDMHTIAANKAKVEAFKKTKEEEFAKAAELSHRARLRY